jgi:anti-anti-sigma factor
VTGPFGVERAELCSVRRDGGVLRLIGDIDDGNSRQIADRIVAEVQAGVVRLDLTRVDFYGAAGVRAVLQGRDALSPGASLHVVCSPLVFRVLHICGLVEADRLIVTPASGEGREPSEVGA